MPHSGPGCGRINLWKCTKNQAKPGNSSLNIAFHKTGMIFNKSLKKMIFGHFCIFGSVKALMVTLGYWAESWLCRLPGRLMQHCWDKKGSLWCPVIFLNINYDQNIANVDLKLIRPHQDSNWPTVGGGAYLIFVIFVTQAGFLEPKFYTEKFAN